MNLLLLFSISSTIRASNAQKPKPKPTTENYKKKIADFLVGSKYEKWCKLTRNVV